MNVFHMEPLRSNGLFVMDAFLVYLIVDYFLEAKGRRTSSRKDGISLPSSCVSSRNWSIKPSSISRKPGRR